LITINPMAQINLNFLGPPRLDVDGKVVEPDTRKATALLAYLAVGGERPSRDALAALLWPDFDDRRAKAALRRTLSALKATVGDAAIYATREVIGLHAEVVWCDVLAFQELLAQEEWATAVDLYRDDFLAGFSLRDSLPFDDWQLQQAEYLRRAYSDALAQLVNNAVASHDFAAGITYARRWLRLDSLREEAHYQLMRLYAWSGQRSAALLQYRDCLRALEEELGVAPLAETTRLYEDIQNDRLAPPPILETPTAAVATAVPPEPAPPLALPPFVGRQKELAAMQSLYRQTSDQVVFLGVSGEAGIGKTRLVETFVNQHPQASCLRAHCYEGETRLAYAPIVTMIRQELDRPDSLARLTAVAPPWLAEVSRLLPDLQTHFDSLPTPPPLDWPGAPGRFLEGITRVLAALLDGPLPGIFWLDDAQWADSATLDLLAYLVHRRPQQPALVLACWREPDLPGNHPLHGLLGQVRRSSSSLVLALNRLSEGEVAELVAQLPVRAAETAVPHIPAGALYRETEGLPFLVTAYLQAQMESGGPDGGWSLPPTARHLFHSRLIQTGETGQQLLQAAAVIGRPFAFDLLLAASGRSEEEAINALEIMLARQLLIEKPGELVFDFSHHKLRDLVYEEMSLVRRRLLHRRIAQALAAQRGAPTDALAGQIAAHYQEAGEEAEAALHYRRAGDHARTLFAHREALDHYKTALALGYPETAVLHEVCADLHVRLGEYAAALTRYEQAAATSPAAQLPHLEHKIGQVHYRRGAWRLAEHHFEQAETGWQNPAAPADLARLYIDWATTSYRAGDMPLAIKLAQQAQALAADTPTQAQAANVAGILARQRGDRTAALAQFNRALELADEHGHLAVQIAALNNLGLMETAVNHLDQAQELLETALHHCQIYGDRHWEAALHSNLADLLHQRGQEEASMTQLKQAVTIYAEIGQEMGDWQPEIWKLSEW